MVDDETITPADAVLPDLGEIPDADDDSPDDQDDEDMDEEDDEEEDDEDDDDSSEDDDEDGRGRRRRRGRVSQKSSSRAGALQKRRGRPPKVFTPVEARIYSLLQGLRKLKHTNGDLLIYPFEKLPDKTSNPDYYTTIANPIALDLIKRKYKRKKYQNVDQAMHDINQMFENAKAYNVETSQLYKDAVQLQNYARELAEQEKSRPDNDFEDEDGRRSVSEIHHKGEVWRVGQLNTPLYFPPPRIKNTDPGCSRRLDSCNQYQRSDKAHHRTDLPHLAGPSGATMGKCLLVLSTRTDGASLRKTFSRE